VAVVATRNLAGRRPARGAYNIILYIVERSVTRRRGRPPRGRGGSISGLENPVRRVSDAAPPLSARVTDFGLDVHARETGTGRGGQWRTHTHSIKYIYI